MGQAERYTIVKKIADGGMAEIFLATQTGVQGFRRNVILKRILPALSADPKLRNMLVDEAHIAMSLNHGNIVQVLDFGEAGGRTFLVMEVVDGWDLATLLGRAQAVALTFPTALALYTTVQICRALAYAHGMSRDGKPLGIVHRDVSPQNVLISEHGEIKLADFGIAKALDRRESTAAGIIKGKLDFMSPEQAAGDPIDARSDLFSTGSMLYLMATGQRPFQAKSDLEVLRRVRNADFPAPAAVYSHIHPKVARIIKKAMKKQPARRYASASAMMEEVEALLRKDFDSAGQSDFERWLQELAARDGMPSVLRQKGLPHSQDSSSSPLFEGTMVALREPSMAADLAWQETQLRPGFQELPTGVGMPMTPAKKLDLGRKGGFLHKAAGYAIVLALSLLVAGLGLRFLAPAATHRLAGEIKRMLGGSPTLVPQQATLRANDGVLLGTDAVARVDGQVEVPSPPPSAPPAPSSLPRLPSAPVDDLPTLPVPAVDPHASIRSGDRTHASSSAMVTLRLVTRPKGAHVRSGSHALGTTPLQRKFPAGVSEELVLTKRGYATVKRMFSVGTSDTTVTVNLDPVSKKAKTKRPARHHHRHRR